MTGWYYRLSGNNTARLEKALGKSCRGLAYKQVLDDVKKLPTPISHILSAAVLDAAERAGDTGGVPLVDGALTYRPPSSRRA